MCEEFSLPPSRYSFITPSSLLTALLFTRLHHACQGSSSTLSHFPLCGIYLLIAGAGGVIPDGSGGPEASGCPVASCLCHGRYGEVHVHLEQVHMPTPRRDGE